MGASFGEDSLSGWVHRAAGPWSEAGKSWVPIPNASSHKTDFTAWSAFHYATYSFLVRNFASDLVLPLSESQIFVIILMVQGIAWFLDVFSWGIGKAASWENVATPV